MKSLLNIMTAAACMLILTASASAQYIGLESSEDIHAEIKSLNKDLDRLRSEGGNKFASKEIELCSKSITAAKAGADKNNLDDAAEKISEARYNLLLGYEKTRNGLARSRYDTTLLYNSAFGLSVSSGIYDTFTQSGKFTSKYGYGIGTGFVFEKMFSNRFGIQSGLGYFETNIPTRMDPMQTSYMEWHMNGISIPLLLITSFNTKHVSLNFLTGINIYNMITSEFFTDDPMMASSRADIMMYVRTSLIMASGGINLKFRFGTFTDLFIGGIAEMSAQNILGDRNNDIIRLWSARATAGMMFRTNMFPMN